LSAKSVIFGRHLSTRSLEGPRPSLLDSGSKSGGTVGLLMQAEAAEAMNDVLNGQTSTEPD
jgi:hypothetical protein